MLDNVKIFLDLTGYLLETSETTGLIAENNLVSLNTDLIR